LNQTEYLNQLNRYLKKLPKSDYENAMDYFTEYFEEAGEQRAIEELGTPKEAAAEILNNLLKQTARNDQSKKINGHSFKRTALISYMSILTLPYGLPATIGMIFLIIAVTLIISCIVLAALICSMMLLWLGAKYLLRGIIALPHSRSGAFILAGTGILGIGLWLLISLCIIWLYQRTIHKGIQILQKFIKGKRSSV
jgi:uncharacterized membrane protein